MHTSPINITQIANSAEKMFDTKISILISVEMKIQEVYSKGAVPSGRYGHASVYDEHTNLIYVHGGLGIDDDYQKHAFNQLYSFNILTNTW